MVFASAAVLWANTRVDYPAVDAWALFSLGFLGILLEITRTHHKASGFSGSLAFVFHLAVGIILGGFWGAVAAGSARLVSQLYFRTPLIKASFNVAERVVTVGTTFLVYSAMGGMTPPDFISPTLSATVPFNEALSGVGVFLAAALVYFLINSVTVNTVIALASGRPIMSTWRSNTVWVLGYDLAASSLALVVTWLFLLSDASAGVGRFAFLLVGLLLVGVRHIYGKLNSLEAVHAELDRAYEELELNVREQLAMMVKAIEARDPYTSGHSRRVSGLSRAIAIDAGLPEDEVLRIENAALLHDVGKIHEEFAPLLQKEGKLTEEEWAIMKTHSIKSAELVSLFSRFQGYVVECVRHHHERWDGRGYPDGVAAEQIPLGARIIAIADTVDAMTTNRPYRQALGIDVVLSELNKGKGTQFDPDLVERAVNSVSVRRLISDPTSIPEHMPVSKSRGRHAASYQGN